MSRRKAVDIPEFASPEDERVWWAEHDAEIDWDALPVETFDFDVTPPQKRTKTVTLRMEPALVNQLKALAEKRGMGYQTLMREVLTAWSARQTGARRGREPA